MQHLLQQQSAVVSLQASERRSSLLGLASRAAATYCMLPCGEDMKFLNRFTHVVFESCGMLLGCGRSWLSQAAMVSVELRKQHVTRFSGKPDP
jgi:hypothetical protein